MSVSQLFARMLLPSWHQSLGSLSESALILLMDLGRRISSAIGDYLVSFSTVVGHTAMFQCHSVAPELCRE